MWCSKMFFNFVLLAFFIIVNESGAEKFGVGQNGNLRVCMVEGKGLYKRAGRFCPILEKENTGLECVVGNDRLDCLRRIGKGTVDFGVFSPEDLVAAQWAGIDVLVTHELKSTSDPFEYSVVALVSKELGAGGGGLAGAESVLRGAALCHPGLGAEEHFSEALADYLESLVVERSCDPNLSLTENKLKSVAEFFKSACRAGPWLPDKYHDNELKTKYGQLCSACYEPGQCSTGDKYWGRQGVLSCLGERSGDVAWARYDDVRMHFGFTEVPATTNPENFMYLCRDGSVRPLANDTEPCVWVAKPWPVIAAKRKSSPAVEATAEAAGPALRALLELQRIHPLALRPPVTPADYLARARGFRAAYSRADCQPSRHITLCATTVSARYKCDWLAEAGTVQGVVPPLQCIQHAECVSSVVSGAADAMVAGPDFLVPARRKHGLMPILYETTPILNDLYSVAAYVKKDSTIASFSEMRNQRVAFPSHEGVAWHSIIQLLKREHLIPELNCPYEESLAEFFGDSCVPDLENVEGMSEYAKEKLTRQCRKNAVGDIKGDGVALRLLAEGSVDIAFISISSVNNYTDGASIEPWATSLKTADFKHICPTGNSYCYLSWATIGQIYIRQNTTKARQSEIETAFKQLDQLFGVSRLFHTAAFSMYGPFDHKPDVLFHNRTKKLSSFQELKMFPMGGLHDNFEQSLISYKYGHCVGSFSFSLTYSSLVLYICLFIQLLNR